MYHSKNKLSLMFLYFFIVFLTEIATDLYIPSLPLIAKYFSVSAGITQKTMTLHLVGFAIGQLIYGPLLDRFGRKPIIISGFGIFVFASIACAFSSNINCLIINRFIQGLGACVAPVVVISALKNQPGQGANHVRMITLLNMTMSLSPIIGPMLGSLLIVFIGWQAPFCLLGLSGFVCWLFLLLSKKESHLVTYKYSSFKMAALFQSRGFIISIISNALIVSTVWLFITEGPFIFKNQFHTSEATFGIYQAITVVGYILGGLVTFQFSKKIASRKLIFIGMILLVIGCVLFFILKFRTALSFTLVLALFEAGIGILRPPLINSALDLFPGYFGTASAVIGCSEMVVSAAVIFLVGIFSNSTLYPFIITIVISVFITLLLYYFNPIRIDIFRNC